LSRFIVRRVPERASDAAQHRLTWLGLKKAGRDDRVRQLLRTRNARYIEPDLDLSKEFCSRPRRQERLIARSHFS
jgi:hypothetical protein